MILSLFMDTSFVKLVRTPGEIPINQSGSSIIKISLVGLMLGSKVWTVERPNM